jgi:hypothetical protein
MEFFRKNSKIIVGVIAITFIVWTVVPMLMAFFTG